MAAAPRGGLRKHLRHGEGAPLQSALGLHSRDLPRAIGEHRRLAAQEILQRAGLADWHDVVLEDKILQPLPGLQAVCCWIIHLGIIRIQEVVALLVQEGVEREEGMVIGVHGKPVLLDVAGIEAVFTWVFAIFVKG